jgi:Domain of unknown function (DUF4157)
MFFAPHIAKVQTKAVARSTHQGSTCVTKPLGQRSIGNRAIRTAFGAVCNEHEQEPNSAAAGRATAPWDFSKIPVFPPEQSNRPHARSPLVASRPSAAIQPKLVVGQTDDPLEHEADRIANQVMSMPDMGAAVFPAVTRGGLPGVQRHCSRGGTCTKCSAEKAEEEHGALLRSPDVPQISTKGSLPASSRMVAPPIVHEVLNSPGQPLDSATRAFMEPRFGHDFSSVRLHTGGAARSSTADLGALGYTVGSHIVLRDESPSPALLAHELAHVVQQASAPAGNRGVVVQRGPRSTPPKTDPKKSTPKTDPPKTDPAKASPPADEYAGWKHPEFGRHYDLAHNNINQYERRHQYDALLDIQTTTLDLINLAIDREKVGLAQLDRIRRDDIWPTWRTLNTALTVAGTLVSCLEGACVVGLITGAISLYDNDSGAALGVAADCLPKPSANCARALTLGAASVATNRLDQSATTKRLPKKEQAALMVANSRIARGKLESALNLNTSNGLLLQDQIKWYDKAFRYAIYGDPHPGNPTWGTEI